MSMKQFKNAFDIIFFDILLSFQRIYSIRLSCMGCICLSTIYFRHFGTSPFIHVHKYNLGKNGVRLIHSRPIRFDDSEKTTIHFCHRRFIVSLWHFSNNTAARSMSQNISTRSDHCTSVPRKTRAFD
jgi:hypothetical protein